MDELFSLTFKANPLIWVLDSNPFPYPQALLLQLYPLSSAPSISSTIQICYSISHLRGTRDQIANICWIIEKAREFQKNIYFCFIDYIKVFDCVDHNKLWKIIKEMGIPDHLTCLLTNLYAGQECKRFYENVYGMAL